MLAVTIIVIFLEFSQGNRLLSAVYWGVLPPAEFTMTVQDTDSVPPSPQTHTHTQSLAT